MTRSGVGLPEIMVVGIVILWAIGLLALVIWGIGMLVALWRIWRRW